VCRVWQMLTLVLVTVLAVACSQTVVSPSFGNDANYSAPTYTRYPTYTPQPTYTLYPTYTLSSLSADAESLIWPNGPRDDVISWIDAADFVGTEMIIEGTVTRTHNSGNAVFLNFSDDRQGGFSVVIFPEDWAKFPAPPETLFYGRRIRAEGLIQEYQGTIEVVVRDPWQIEVALTLGQEEAYDCGTPAVIEVVVTATPSTGDELASAGESATQSADVRPPTSASEVISWRDAAAFTGQTVNVEGRVIDTYNSGKVVFLNFDEDYQNTFKVVIFPEVWPLFPQPPEDLYRDRVVRVSGQVEIYQGAPEIIVETPDAIQILE
jgi:DNA/RNA endonuclease YhcR with UshA esterase domain